MTCVQGDAEKQEEDEGKVVKKQKSKTVNNKTAGEEVPLVEESKESVKSKVPE